MNVTLWLGAGASLVVIIGGLAVWFRWLRKPWRRVVQFLARVDQTINGKPAELDAYNREVAPAIPPLAEQMSGIRSTVEMLVERDERLTALETTVAEHGQRLTAVEAGHQIERSLGHVAAAKTFDAIEAVARKNQPEPHPADEPDTEL